MRRPKTIVRPLLALIALTATTLVMAQAAPPEEFSIGMILPSATGDALDDAVARAARQGAVMAEEEFVFNAQMLGVEFTLPMAEANGAEDAVAAAEMLVAEHDVAGIVGGFGFEEAVALSNWSAQTGVPFLNIAEPSDRLRGELCQESVYHVEISAAMYIDALAGWYVRSGFRRWYLVHSDDPEGESLRERMTWSLRERHFGARIVGTTAVPAGEGDLEALANRVRRSGADLIVLLLGAHEQLRLLAGLEEQGVDVTVAGFPYQDTQTRTFYRASRDAAPTLGTGHRAGAWEATLDSYGAREFNSRYRLRWEEPMETSAWIAYQGVKILYEAIFLGGSEDPADIERYLLGPAGIFDIWKGIGASFRPWDHQLRQSLYLVKINETAEDAQQLGLLVGELPAIYLPGTDPVERLDQLGDLEARSSCRF